MKRVIKFDLVRGMQILKEGVMHMAEKQQLTKEEIVRELQPRVKSAIAACKPVKMEKTEVYEIQQGIEQLACMQKALTKTVLNYFIEKDKIPPKQKAELKKDVDKFIASTEKIALSFVDDSKRPNGEEVKEYLKIMVKLNKYIKQGEELKLP